VAIHPRADRYVSFIELIDGAGTRRIVAFRTPRSGTEYLVSGSVAWQLNLSRPW